MGHSLSTRGDSPSPPGLFCLCVTSLTGASSQRHRGVCCATNAPSSGAEVHHSLQECWETFLSSGWTEKVPVPGCIGSPVSKSCGLLLRLSLPTVPHRRGVTVTTPRHKSLQCSALPTSVLPRVLDFALHPPLLSASPALQTGRFLLNLVFNGCLSPYSSKVMPVTYSSLKRKHKQEKKDHPVPRNPSRE